MTDKKRWTQDEIDILRKVYPTLGSVKTSELIGKTRRSIIYMAHRNNIKYQKPIKEIACKEIKHRHKWTDDEIEFLIDHYPYLGGHQCALRLGITFNSISHKVGRLSILVTKERRSIAAKERTADSYHGSKRIYANDFIECTRPEIAYILGFLWADGYFLRKNYRIGVSTSEKDFEDLYTVFIKAANWYIAHRKARGVGKRTVSFEANDKATFEFLESHQYKSGRTCSPDTIIKHTGDFAPYWFRGYFDGDGCFYHNTKQSINQMSFAGNYDQDWSFIINLLDSLDINYKIDQRIQKHGKSSVVRCFSIQSIINFGNYIYGDRYDNIGLERKHNSFLQIHYSSKNDDASSIASLNANGLCSPSN